MVAPLNKYVKYILIFLGVVASVIAVIVGLFFWSMSSSHEQAEKDGKEFSEQCDTIRYITERPEITLIEFKQKPIDKVLFQILRDKKFISDTLVKGKFESSGSVDFVIPYQKFLKTDTIVLITKNKLKYYISGFHHYAALHYGMTGYVGTAHCRFSNNCTINNAESNGTISKASGWINPDQMKNRKIIHPVEDDYENFASKSAIKLKEAKAIFIKNRKNKHLYSLFSYGIEVYPTESFYIFGEQIEGKTNQTDIIRINTKTGVYKRYTNYPFEN